jgi:hypothetical protein
MAANLIPHTDTDFDKLQNQFVGAVAASPATYGVPAADVAQLQADQATWNLAYPAHVKAQEDAATAAQKKTSARTKLAKDIRGVAKKINGEAGVDNAMRASAGMPPHDTARTPAVAPATKPIGRAEPGGHSTVALHVADVLTPKRAARPKGAIGYQLWVHTGDPAPADPTGYTFVKRVTRTPYVDVHPAADAGKTVYYLVRWEGPRGDTGPWSDVIVGKIPL